MELNWLKSYLIGTKQYTFVNDIKHDTLNCKCGVPQETVLGTLLFLIYINDVANVTLNSTLKLIVDDCNLFVVADNFNQLAHKATENRTEYLNGHLILNFVLTTIKLIT